MRTRSIYLLMGIFFAFGCIEPYTPVIPGESVDSYVITGSITSMEGFQEVNISQTSDLQDPHYIPVSSCKVSISDGNGRKFDLREFESGKYKVWMEQASLEPGNAYRLSVALPSGELIESDYDSMPAPGYIDAVYYEREEKYDANSQKDLNGYQFYADIHSDQTGTGYFRFAAEETWEHHTPMLKEFYYDGSIHKVYPPENSMYHICWSTDDIGRIFTLSTKNLVSNGFIKFPLQYVDNTSNRLLVAYSTEISLYALSEAAYNFWEKIRINSEAKGQLYESQPVTIEGNLHSITNPERKVIGFFDAVSVTRKRIFVEPAADMGITDGCFCSPEELGMGGWSNVDPWEYPVYFTYTNYMVGTLQLSCVDCRAIGGTIVKPTFWP